MLDLAINDLSSEAHNVQLALKDVHNLVVMIKKKAEDTKGYIEVEDELHVKDQAKLNDGQMDLWEMTLESLLDTLNTAKVEYSAI